MASERQIAANRANAAKSTGPKTSQGKAASSRNNLRHGLFASTVVLEAEDLARFHLLRANLQADFPPESILESALLETLALTRWRQLRLWAIEKATLTNEMRRQNLDQSVAPATRLAVAFRTLGDESRVLDIIGRLENRFERQFNAALDRLLRIREEKTAFCLIQSQSLPVSRQIFQQRQSRDRTTPGKKRTRRPFRPASRIKEMRFSNTKPISSRPSSPASFMSRPTPGLQKQTALRPSHPAKRGLFSIPIQLEAAAYGLANHSPPALWSSPYRRRLNMCFLAEDHV